MTVHINSDFADFILCLNEFQVEYLVVGGYAVIHYGHSRNTGDIDIWVRKSEDNYKKLRSAFLKFGMPVFDMTKENFLANPAMNVFTFGKSPVCIEILTQVQGLQFDEAFQNSIDTTWDNVPVKVIDLKDLIRAKKASARYKDLDDLENIQ